MSEITLAKHENQVRTTTESSGKPGKTTAHKAMEKQAKPRKDDIKLRETMHVIVFHHVVLLI